jgi:hypothetical protein
MYSISTKLGSLRASGWWDSPWRSRTRERPPLVLPGRAPGAFGPLPGPLSGPLVGPLSGPQRREVEILLLTALERAFTSASIQDW